MTWYGQPVTSQPSKIDQPAEVSNIFLLIVCFFFRSTNTMSASAPTLSTPFLGKRPNALAGFSQQNSTHRGNVMRPLLTPSLSITGSIASTREENPLTVFQTSPLTSISSPGSPCGQCKEGSWSLWQDRRTGARGWLRQSAGTVHPRPRCPCVPA